MSEMSDLCQNRIAPGWRVVAYAFLGFFTLLTLLPLAWMFFSSFKTQGDIMIRPLAFPLSPTLENYFLAWELGSMGRSFISSIIYTGVGTVGTVGLSMAAGFALTKFGYKSSRFYFSFFMLGLLITVNAVIAPLYYLETRIGLYNTYAGVISPYIAFGMPMGVLLACSYVRGIPNALIEAASIDGAGYIRIFAAVIVPVSIPVISTISVLTFLRNWNEFILVFILTRGEGMRSLPVAINSFAGRLVSNYGLQLAALTLGTIPMILFYIATHNLLIKGFGEGALKE